MPIVAAATSAIAKMETGDPLRCWAMIKREI